MTEPRYEEQEMTLDLREVVKVIRKRFGMILGIFLVAVVAAAILSLLIPPTYEAETTLRIKQSKGLASSLLDNIPMGNVMATQQLISTYAEILKSRTVIESVIRKTQLGELKIPTYENMLNRIATQPVKDTEILKVSVQARSPEQAMMIANTLVDTFLDRMTYLVRSEQTTVRDFIGERLRDAKKELQTAEADLEAYKQGQKIVAPTEETKALVDNMSKVEELAAENKLNLATAQARLDNINRQLAGEKSDFIADSPLITQYKTKLGDLEIQLVGLLEKYTPKHPDVLATKAAIEETRAKLNQEINRVINAEAPSMNPIHQTLVQGKMQAEAEIKAAAAQREAIAKLKSAHDQVLMKLPAKEQGLTRLMRDAAVAQEIYIMLAKRFEEARISEVMQPTDVQIIDKAVAPEKPIKPKKTLNVLIAGFLGLFAGLGLAFLLEYLNKTMTSVDDVKYYLDLPVLGNIPDFDSDEKANSKKFLSWMQKTQSKHKRKKKKK